MDDWLSPGSDVAIPLHVASGGKVNLFPKQWPAIVRRVDGNQVTVTFEVRGAEHRRVFHRSEIKPLAQKTST